MSICPGQKMMDVGEAIQRREQLMQKLHPHTELGVQEA